MVDVPIRADISGLQQAFDRLNEALNRAGQSAKALSQVDLAHPELKDFAADLETINDRFNRLTTQGRGEAAAVARQFRSSGNLFGAGGLLTGGVQATYPNQSTAARVQAQLQGYLLSGTSFSPQQQGGGGGGGGGGAGQMPQLAMPSMISGAMGLAGGAASSMLGIMGIGSLAVMAKTAFELAQKQGIAVDTLMRRINDSGTDFDRFRGAMSEATRGLGLTSTAFVAVAQTYQRLSGETGDVTGNARFGVGAARAFGTDEGTIAAGMGRAQFMGVDPKQFALLLGEAVVRGGQTGQAEQVQDALLRGLDSLNRNLVTGGAISGGFGQFAALYTTLNQQAVATNAPGMRGAGALGALETINQSIMSGGNAGMAGQLLQMSAFNRHGVYNPYEIEGTVEGGMFAQIRGGPTVLQAEMEEINRRYGANATGEGQFLYRHVIKRMLGLNQPITAALQAMPEIGPNLTGLYSGGTSSLMNTLHHAGVDLNTLKDTTSLQDLVSIGLGSSSTLESYRERALKRDDLSDAQKAQISGAAPDDLRDTLLKIYAAAGQEKDDATKLREAMAKLTDTFTAIGGQMIHALLPVGDALTTIATPLNDLAAYVNSIGKKIGDAIGTTSLGSEDNTFWEDWRKTGDFGGALRRSWHLGGGGGEGGVPGPQSISSAEQEATARQIIGTMAPLFGDHGGFGLAGEAMTESGMNPRARNPKTGAYGLFQYMPGAPRTKLLEEYLGKPLYEWTKDDQIRAKAYDLSLGSEHKVGARLRAAQTDEEAGAIAANEDARAYNPWDPRYGMYAKAVGQTAKNLRNQLTPGVFPLPPEPPSGGAGATQSIIRVDPLTVNHQINGVDLWQQVLPTSVTAPQPSNPPKPLVRPSNTGSAAPAPAPPPPRPPAPPATIPSDYIQFPMVQ